MILLLGLLNIYMKLLKHEKMDISSKSNMFWLIYQIIKLYMAVMGLLEVSLEKTE